MTSGSVSTARGDWREGLPEGVAREGLPPARAIRFDSRQVAAGDVFVCAKGEHADGHDFAAQAVERGAVALVCEAGRGAALDGLGVPVVEVPEPRVTLARAT